MEFTITSSSGPAVSATVCPYCQLPVEYGNDNITHCPHCHKTIFYIWDDSRFVTNEEYLAAVQERSLREYQMAARRFNFVTKKFQALGQNLLAADLAALVKAGTVRPSIKVKEVGDEYSETIEWILFDYESALPSPRALAYLVSLGYTVDRLLTKTETSYLIDMMKVSRTAPNSKPFSTEEFGTFTLEQAHKRLDFPYTPISVQETMPLHAAPDRVMPVPPPVVEKIHEIRSADLSLLGSAKLFDLRDKILSAYEQKERLYKKFKAIHQEYRTQSRLWFGLKKLLAPYFGELEEYRKHLEFLAAQEKAAKSAWEKYRLRSSVRIPERRETTWKKLTQAFAQVCASKVYDVVSEKEVAGRKTKVCEPVTFKLESKDIIAVPYPVLYLQNANGADIYIYPNFIIMEDGATVAVIDIAELTMTESVQDRYEFTLETDSGLNEMYQIEDREAGKRFGEALRNHVAQSK